jgi:hypothetical protein
MNYAEALASGSRPLPKLEFPSMICEDLPTDSMRAECLFFSAHEDIRIREGDVIGFWSWCTSSPGFAQQQERCWAATGTYAGRVQDFALVADLCFAPGGSESGQNACRGAIVASLFETGALEPQEAVVRVCAVLGDRERCNLLEGSVNGLQGEVPAGSGPTQETGQA